MRVGLIADSGQFLDVRSEDIGVEGSDEVRFVGIGDGKEGLASSMPAACRMRGSLPEPSRVCTSLNSMRRRSASGFLSTTTTSLFS